MTDNPHMAYNEAEGDAVADGFHYTLFMPYACGYEDLCIALRSITPLLPNTVVLDNTPNGNLQLPDDIARCGVNIWRGVDNWPMNFVETMNYIRADAVLSSDDAILFMHSDGYAGPGMAEEFLQHVKSHVAGGKPWGALFTLYDVLCAFNPYALDITGKWDRAFTQYVSDCDYYHRLRHWGFPTIETHIGIEHRNNASTTIRHDPYYRFRSDHFQPSFQSYYREKWGGAPGEERSLIPFQGRLSANAIRLIQGTDVFKRLSAINPSTEGNLLECTSLDVASVQVETLRHFVLISKATCILEIGTNKGMFGLWLSTILTGCRLHTFCDDPNSAKAVEILNEATALDITFYHGDSRKTLPNVNFGKDEIHLAWVDGGHDKDVVTSDLANVMRMGVWYVLIDDCNMPTVEAAINETLLSQQGRSLYREVYNPYYALEPRGIRVFRYIKL